jgi:hypothetical protein
MTPTETVIIPPNLFRLLGTLIISNLLMIGGIIAMSIGLFGFGNWTIFACSGVVGLNTLFYVIAVIRGRPRVVITTDGFVFEKPIGHETREWSEIEGSFAVIRIAMHDAVAYKLTPECRARLAKKPDPRLSGYDGVLGGSLPCSAAQLAALLNEHKEHHKSPAD